MAAAAAAPVDISNGDDASLADASLAGSDRRSTGSAGLRLHRSSEAAQLRAMRLQQELLLREAEECTFQPRLHRSGSAAPPSRGRTKPTAFFERSRQWAQAVEDERAEKRRQLERSRWRSARSRRR